MSLSLQYHTRALQSSRYDILRVAGKGQKLDHTYASQHRDGKLEWGLARVAKCRNRTTNARRIAWKIIMLTKTASTNC